MTRVRKDISWHGKLPIANVLCQIAPTHVLWEGTVELEQRIVDGGRKQIADTDSYDHAQQDRDDLVQRPCSTAQHSTAQRQECNGSRNPQALRSALTHYQAVCLRREAGMQGLVVARPLICIRPMNDCSCELGRTEYLGMRYPLTGHLKDKNGRRHSPCDPRRKRRPSAHGVATGGNLGAPPRTTDLKPPAGVYQGGKLVTEETAQCATDDEDWL